ncbi:MAG: hypothetical protein K0S65_3420, partial [Labilithrix sp.]|nr:hypothetical protein [Labilithrix sp.]
LEGRIEEIEQIHAERLARVEETCATPCTIDQIACDLFGGPSDEPEGQSSAWKLFDAGAYVEHLRAHRRLRIDDPEANVTRYVSKANVR